MSNAFCRNEYRTATVCVDSYHNGIPTGRIYHARRENGIEFHSLMQFLTHMEQTMDEADFPKAFTATRTFAPPAELPATPPECTCYTGEQATFAIRILFRQNSSWQGSVIWLEGQQERSFRSVLELIFLLDNALRCPKSA